MKKRPTRDYFQTSKLVSIGTIPFSGCSPRKSPLHAFVVGGRVRQQRYVDWRAAQNGICCDVKDCGEKWMQHSVTSFSFQISPPCHRETYGGSRTISR